jgi:small-conductance mechanosensitive channel
LEWADLLTRPASDLVWTLALAAAFGSVVVSLGSALFLIDKPSWRLLSVDDPTALVLRPFPFATACVVALGAGLIELNRIVGASPAANVTANLLGALLHVGLLVAVLVALRRLRNARDAEAGQITERRSIVTIAMLIGWIAVVVCLIALARGNVNLALLIGREIVWILTIVSSAYLLMVALDDLFTTMLSEEGRFGRVLARSFGLRESTVRQLGLAISILARVAIGFFAVASVLAPLGGGTAPAYTQLSGIGSIAVGGIVIQPGSILRSLAVLALGLGAVRLLGRWMDGTFLPATELDAGARNSTSTIVRYVGIVLVVAWAVSSLGVGVERIALLASALSVGIGFGLQAITQNFISGLILLAERPVKIGDTIRVGTDEGDVKSINVRSTEIQIGDRSTLIIPNSELITKSVRNMTLANPLGRVQIVFSVPMEEDADEIIAILMQLFEQHPSVLADPTPSVMIDSLVEGKINFNGIAFVSSPRLTYATRSELLLHLLRRLKARGMSSEAGIRETEETAPSRLDAPLASKGT